MPNNPLQIVLNTNEYQQLPNRTGGSSKKDLFEGKDMQFASHRERLLENLDQIGRRFEQPEQPALEYVHVLLNEEAWAKTKRPTQKVFQSDKVPLVGGGELGEMIFELVPETLSFVRSKVSSAEIEVPMVQDKKTDKVRPNPSRVRCEVGAIESIYVHRAADRRGFSAQDAVEWLADPRTGRMYIVECFINPLSEMTPSQRRIRARAVAEFERLKTQLVELDIPITIEDTGERWTSLRFLLIKVDSQEVLLHEQLLSFLDESRIVRKVSLPPILKIQQAEVTESGNAATFPTIDISASYPVLGIVDTGVASHSALEPWCEGRTDLMDGVDQDRSHGTFIAGLVVAANELNSHAVFDETPCKYFDLGLHPTEEDSYENYYPGGFLDFLEQLSAEIPAAAAAGARIFNMSISVEQQVTENNYSEFAALLDEIADRHDVIFVLPSGNLNFPIWRSEWPSDATLVAQMLAGYRHAGQDRLFQPAESLRAVSVGALDVPDGHGLMKPSVYSRRGPSIALGIKPDVAHVGGKGGRQSYLNSIDVNGDITNSCGTSYAAPFAAKTLAALNHHIEGDIDRETLRGLLVHHAYLPAPLDEPSSAMYVSDFVGHGLPSLAMETLLTGDHSITLAFVGNLAASHELEFPFTWPASMVNNNGSCRGRIKLTLSYSAPTNRLFGAEYVRVNMNAYLRQEYIDKDTGEVAWKGRTQSDGKIYERHLIQHGLKWWPTKKFGKTFPRGVGNSSQWKLVVDSLCRTDVGIPEDGLQFSVILTIEDPAQEAPVFNELRQTLRNSGAQISDIRTAQRVITRA